jgi:transcriptional regulator with XRE-family HTH domain
MSATLTPRHRNRSNTTGRKIRARRRSRGLSPEQLGDLAGVSGRTIRRIEEGSTALPNVRSQFLIAQELDCELIDLWP